jgi:TIR domain
MSDIFISYARPERNKAELLANSFAQKGWSVWWDRDILPGKSFDTVIEKALDSARCVVVLWSKQSALSDWVKAEAAEGARRGILVPVLLENELKIPLEFRRIQAANLSDWRGTSPHPEFDGLLKAVAMVLADTIETRNTQTTQRSEALESSRKPSGTEKKWHAELVEKSWMKRVVRVHLDHEPHVISYRHNFPEMRVFIAVDDKALPGTSTEESIDFEISDGDLSRPTNILVNANIWSGYINHFRLCVANCVVYEDGK